MGTYFYSNNELINYELGDILSSPIRAFFLVSDAFKETIEVTIKFADDEIEDFVLPFVATIENKHYYSFPYKLIKSVNNTIPKVDEETPTPTPTPTNNEQEPIDDYIYDSMEAVSIIGGNSDGDSVVGYNDRSLTTIQGVNGVTGLTLENNIVTLTEAGRYYIKARTGAYKCGIMWSLVKFLTGDYQSQEFLSPERYSRATNNDMITSECSVVVDVTQTTTLKIQTKISEATDSGLSYGGESTLFVQKLASVDGGSSGGGSSTSGISAWGVFDGTANYDDDNYLPIKASENIESIKYISTGIYEVTMTNPMPTEHYSVSVNCNPSGYGGAYGGVMDFYSSNTYDGNLDVPTASKFKIDVRTASNVLTNSNRISFHVVSAVTSSGSTDSSSSDTDDSVGANFSSLGNTDLFKSLTDGSFTWPDQIITLDISGNVVIMNLSFKYNTADSDNGLVAYHPHNSGTNAFIRFTQTGAFNDLINLQQNPWGETDEGKMANGGANIQSYIDKKYASNSSGGDSSS